MSFFFLLKHCFYHERFVFKFECLSEDEHCTLLERHISIFSRIYATKRYNTNELELDLMCVAFFQCPMAVIKWRKGHEHEHWASTVEHSRCEWALVENAPWKNSKGFEYVVSRFHSFWIGWSSHMFVKEHSMIFEFEVIEKNRRKLSASIEFRYMKRIV